MRTSVRLVISQRYHFDSELTIVRVAVRKESQFARYIEHLSHYNISLFGHLGITRTYESEKTSTNIFISFPKPLAS